MIILFNTDKNIDASETINQSFVNLIADDLRKFSTHISRVIAFVSDENAAKIGLDDKKCLLEVRLNGKQPIAVTHHANTVHEAVNGALEKIKISFEKLSLH